MLIFPAVLETSAVTFIYITTPEIVIYNKRPSHTILIAYLLQFENIILHLDGVSKLIYIITKAIII